MYPSLQRRHAAGGGVFEPPPEYEEPNLRGFDVGYDDVTDSVQYMSLDTYVTLCLYPFLV